MVSWETLTRRQQIWILKWQYDVVRGILRAKSCLDRSVITPGATVAISPERLGVVRIDAEHAAIIEKACQLSAGTILPYDEVPGHDHLPAPTETGVVYVENAPDEPGKAPAWIVDHVVRKAIAQGATTAAIIRAADIDPSCLDECLSGERTAVPRTMIRRLSIALSRPDIMDLVQPEQQDTYLLVKDEAGGRRIVLRLAMERTRALAISSVLEPHAEVRIDPIRRPGLDPVSVIADALVTKEVADMVLRSMMSHCTPKRRL